MAGDEFADGLGHGITIAWQNVPHIGGVWAQWGNVAADVTTGQFLDVHNTLAAGNRASTSQLPRHLSGLGEGQRSK
ncbi:MAG: hypothetical protein P8R42_05145 [Candidatus Binatia bacterium]|nr:hypothetical protein [Candidatus Binatia bacterium]